jgi:hypothetical protein
MAAIRSCEERSGTLGRRGTHNFMLATALRSSPYPLVSSPASWLASPRAVAGCCFASGVASSCRMQRTTSRLTARAMSEVARVSSESERVSPSVRLQSLGRQSPTTRLTHRGVVSKQSIPWFFIGRNLPVLPIYPVYP